MKCTDHAKCGRVSYAFASVALGVFALCTAANMALFVVVGGWCLTTVTADGRIFWPLWMPTTISRLILAWPICATFWRLSESAHAWSAKRSQKVVTPWA